MSPVVASKLSVEDGKGVSVGEEASGDGDAATRRASSRSRSLWRLYKGRISALSLVHWFGQVRLVEVRSQPQKGTAVPEERVSFRSLREMRYG